MLDHGRLLLAACAHTPMRTPGVRVHLCGSRFHWGIAPRTPVRTPRTPPIAQVARLFRGAAVRSQYADDKEERSPYSKSDGLTP